MTLCFSALYPCLAGFGEILAQWLFFGGLLGKRAASLRILPWNFPAPACFLQISPACRPAVPVWRGFLRQTCRIFPFCLPARSGAYTNLLRHFPTRTALFRVSALPCPSTPFRNALYAGRRFPFPRAGVFLRQSHTAAVCSLEYGTRCPPSSDGAPAPSTASCQRWNRSFLLWQYCHA